MVMLIGICVLSAAPLSNRGSNSAMRSHGKPFQIKWFASSRHILWYSVGNTAIAKGIPRFAVTAIGRFRQQRIIRSICDEERRGAGHYRDIPHGLTIPWATVRDRVRFQIRKEDRPWATAEISFRLALEWREMDKLEQTNNFENVLDELNRTNVSKRMAPFNTLSQMIFSVSGKF
jgi:hypothetical protein